jgi:hypothetical protein
MGCVANAGTKATCGRQATSFSRIQGRPTTEWPNALTSFMSEIQKHRVNGATPATPVRSRLTADVSISLVVYSKLAAPLPEEVVTLLMTNSTPTLAVWRGATLVAKLMDNETPQNCRHYETP